MRSLRRQLMLSLSLGAGMVLVLAAGGLSGLISYRSVIQSVERTLADEPNRGDIVTALAWAFDPLQWPDMAGAEGRSLQQTVVRERLAAAREACSDYLRRLERCGGPFDARLPTELVIRRIDDHLQRLETQQVPLLAQVDSAPATIAAMRQELSGLQLLALRIPRPEQTVDTTLEKAREVYRSRLWWIVGSLLIAAALFFGLAQSLYRGIFRPLRQLHEGASRVALGDFSHRVRLPGNDEITQLAEKFNLVTERFQHTRDQLDREVQVQTKQALRSERLAGVGFLAAGVAHEINNPLSAIAMAAESLESRLPSTAAGDLQLSADEQTVVRHYLGMIQRESFRCQQITQRLLDFSRGNDGPRTQVDLTRTIVEVLDMVSHMSRFRGHEIQFDRGRSVPVHGNPAELKQVVLNLVANALESMEGSGRLSIELTELPGEVVCTFTDTGCGMTPHVLENLFEPFFTEKKSGRGTGLGLSISHRIITDHGGRIEADSPGPGQGSVFRIHLPRMLAARQAA